jgi:hypothetical protein
VTAASFVGATFQDGAATRQRLTVPKMRAMGSASRWVDSCHTDQTRQGIRRADPHAGTCRRLAHVKPATRRLLRWCAAKLDLGCA